MINPSVTGSALNQIPLVNSTQILTASAQAPINSVVASTPVIAGSTPIVASTPVTPIMASTPVMTPTSVIASTPVVGSAVQTVGAPVLGASVPVTPVASAVPQPVVTSTLPINTVSPYQVVDDDYRLGRGILDDFRPNAYKSSAVVGTSVTTTPALVTSTPVAAVRTSNINDFL